MCATGRSTELPLPHRSETPTVSKTPTKGTRTSSRRPSRKPPRKRGWNYPRAGYGPVRRWLPGWRFLLGTFVAGLAVAIGLVGAAYLTTEVPEPDDLALAQSSTVYFSDGTTPIGTLSEVNRTIVDAGTLPSYVGDAVVASEDRRFYSNSGIDPVGIARALWSNIRGGQRQGGSTLTQQYVENYYLGRTTSYAGKVKEAILAVKVEQEMTKPEILGAYLNTIYFGRGAYGIEAAAKAYFGKPASELTLSESAMLAGIIPAPSAWDPAISPDKAEQRWGRTLDFMLDEGMITQEERDAQVFPEVLQQQRSDRYAGPNGYLLNMVVRELTQGVGGEEAPFTEDELNRLGVSVVSTFDVGQQAAAVETIEQDLPADHAEGLKATLVSIDPTTGGVTALYGGTDFLTEGLNRATQAVYQGGSTFKPFALVAALEQGMTLEQTYDSPGTLEIGDWKVSNFDLRDKGEIDLATATGGSVNTYYAQL
ncbi:MAG: penicillin-binding protein, partial [Salana multivorans]|nr:penicillin-binding protein [Salana multivorans]